MAKIIIVFIAVSVVLSIGFFYWQSSTADDKQSSTEIDPVNNQKQNIIKSYVNLSSAELADMLVQKDFKLIDIHIPEQRHIPGTDRFIPFNEIERIIEILPDKNEKIALYCRSGNMSRQVAEELMARGYTDISHLENGLNEWIAEKRETLPIGNLQ